MNPRATFAAIALLISAGAPTLGNTDLMVSANRHYLTKLDGQPWFYLGDTAWLLSQRQTREQVDQYLDDRARDGFSAIQVMGLPELRAGVSAANAYGQTPLLNNNPTTPNDAFWEHMDYIAQGAADRGMYLALLPTWGSYVHDPAEKIFNTTNAYDYGLYLGHRYKNQTNIIWVLGGDRPANGDEAIWRAMARGIAVGAAGSEDYGKTMMTYHPRTQESGTSSTWFHNDAWLDFNMLQSGHQSQDRNNYTNILNDFNRSPVKPTMDGEARYEHHPINANPANGYYNDFDVRQAAYWALFAGAHGHTYGNHNIWQFYEPGRPPLISPLLDLSWQEALDAPGGNQMHFARDLIESRPMLNRIPDQALLIGGGSTFYARDHIRATRNADGSYAFIYSAGGNPITVNLNRLTGHEVKAWWYNPQDGTVIEIGTFARSGNRTFTPPTTRPFGPPAPGQPGYDWVLVLDDPAKGYVTPGTFFTKRSSAQQDETFVRGVNLNGNAVVIGTNRWQSFAEAVTDGLTLNQSSIAASTRFVRAGYAYGTDEWHMLNSTLTATGRFALGLELDAGQYRIVLYTIAQKNGEAPDYDVFIEGLLADGPGWTTDGYHWATREIYATVTDGILSIALEGIDPGLSGLAVFTAVPEPGSLLLLTFAAGAVACRCHTSRKRTIR